MTQALIDWFGNAARRADLESAGQLRATAETLGEFAEFDLKEVAAYLESCLPEHPDKPTIAENDHAALLLNEVVASFDAFFAATPKKLLGRLLRILAVAGNHGGLRKIVAENQSEPAKTLIGLWREIQAHEIGSPVSSDLKTVLKKSTVGRLREVSRKLGLDAKGGKTALFAEIETCLAGSENPDSEPPSTDEARQLLTRLRKEASAGASSAKLEPIFAQFEALDPAVIVALGAEYHFGEKKPRKLLKLFRASIEEIQAQANRS